jgi:aminopeptidase N
VNLGPFFDQWVYKPGHPVIDFSWRWDEKARQVVVTVKQVQDRAGGTPLFDMKAKVGLICGAQPIKRAAFPIARQHEELRIVADRAPDAVLFDPDHDLLLEYARPSWSSAELLPVLKFAPNAVDRAEAMARLLAGQPSDTTVQAVALAVKDDRAAYPVFPSIERLAELERPALRPLYRELLDHPSIDRRAQAILALGRLPRDDADEKALRALVNADEPYDIVSAAVAALADCDARGNRDVFLKAAALPWPDGQDRLGAFAALAQADAQLGTPRRDTDPQASERLKSLLFELANRARASPLLVPGLLDDEELAAASDRLALWSRNLKSIVCLAHEDIKERWLEHNGAAVSRIFYYELLTGADTLYVSSYLTADGKLADLDFLLDPPDDLPKP